MKTKELTEHSLLAPLIGKRVLIRFDGLEFISTLISAEPQKVTSLRNPPTKRQTAEGKSYTPKCIRLVFDTGALVLCTEDYTAVAVRSGIAFMFPNYIVEVRNVD